MRRIVTCLAAAALTTVALAQPERGDRRGGFGGGPGGPDGGPPTPGRMLERMADMLRGRLDLDDAQQVQLDEIVAAIREGAELNGGPGDMQALFEEMRTAREAGDDARVDELREQMRGQFRQMGDTMTALLDQVEPILSEEQVGQLSELRQRMNDRMRGGDPRQQAQEAIRDMRQELKLNDEQATQFDTLVEEFRARGREAGQRMGDMRSIFEELRTAREAGDTAKVEELRAQIEQQRPDPRRWMEEFLDGVEGIVGPEQAAIVQKYRDRLAAGPGGERGREARELDPRAIIDATRRLDLTKEQRDQLKQLESEAGRAFREIDRQDRTARAEFVDSFKQEVIAVLTEEQAVQFERLLAQGGRDRGGRDGERSGDGERGARDRGGERGARDRGGERAGGGGAPRERRPRKGGDQP